MDNDQPEILNDGQIENALLYLNQNPYGLLFGDDDADEYEFIWASSPEELFKKAYEMVFNAKLSYIEDEGGTELDQESKGALEKARGHFEIHGLTHEVLTHLMSIDPYGERAGISWWGSFEQLKVSEDVWPQQIRGSFRGNSKEPSITAEEEADFASYLTREPFKW